MSSNPEERPFSDTNLESAEYRQRLLRKLNCLTAVLEVAIAKVHRNLAGPAPDVERLKRIQGNLNDTLEVCKRARKALERSEQLPAELSGSLSQVVGRAEVEKLGSARPAKRGELSATEQRKFRALAPIDKKSIRHVDLEELSRLLQGD